MKKLLIIALAALCLSGCTKPKSALYVVSGHYCACGEVITDDGNIWGYSQDMPIGDNKPVYVVFSDAGTPDNIYDDKIVGLVGRD